MFVTLDYLGVLYCGFVVHCLRLEIVQHSACHY